MKISCLFQILSRMAIIPSMSLLLVLFPQNAKCKASAAELISLSLEQLMDIEITSVSKKSEKMSEAAAAIFVITQDDIRRSGATSIAEALRMAPGLHVARITSHEWVVTSRGFSSRFANKLLVLIDGRSIYTPLFSGVFWDVQDVLLEDIERIEVIRGPGASLWGANAVNGVINIITKKSNQTQGALLTAGGGIEERAFGSVRYGGKINDQTYYRAYFKYFDRDPFTMPAGEDGHDQWSMKRGGFRTDWSPDSENTVTFQGDAYEGDIEQIFNLAAFVPPFSSAVRSSGDVSGGNFLSKWQHEFSDTSSTELQFYYDNTKRKSFIIKEIRDTFDFDFQHRFVPLDRHDVLWGLGYRLSIDDITNSSFVAFTPDSRNDELFSAFFQDEFTFIEDVLSLTIGSKFEHNDYTGFEVQPSARLLWAPCEKHTFWGSVSKAVRIPSRFEHDMFSEIIAFPGDDGVINTPAINGDINFDSEDLLAFEAGHRMKPIEKLTVDTAVFYNIYDHLRTFDLKSPFFNATPAPHVVLPLHTTNNMEGESYGIEISNHFQLTDYWRISGSYSLFILQLHSLEFNQGLLNAEGDEGASPEQQFQIHSNLNLPGNFTFDAAWYYVGDVEDYQIDSYHRIDARLAWKPRADTEISLVVQNIFEARHLEFGPEFLTTPTEVERVIYAKYTFIY